MNPWTGMAIVVVALGLCFLVLRLVEKFASPHPELLRKLLHVTMGFIAATFPWLFDQAWPVLLLAAGSVVALLLVRRGVSVARSFQGVLHGVERHSWGELLFPVAVAIVFVLADGDPLLFSVPILILALADAVAALIGIAYGKIKFSTLEGAKSIEGSLAFFIVTFFCVHIAILLSTDTGRVESVVIGLLMGVIVMMFEAIAWRGLDNLFIPVASFALLETYLGMDATALLVRLVVIVLLGLLLLVIRRRTTLDDSALVGAVLIAYGVWAIGDLYWLSVPLLVFVIATSLSLRLGPEHSARIHTVHALLSIAGPGLFWLLLHNNIGPDLFFSYCVAFGAHLTMLGISRAHFGHDRLNLMLYVPAIIQGCLVVLLPFLFYTGFDRGLMVIFLVGALAMVFTALAFVRLQPTLENCPVTPARWTRQGLIASVISVLAWLFMWLQGVGGVQG